MAKQAPAAAELPDELLLEIFARVAPEILDLVRCAGTCTRWFRLIADPAFLRRAGLLPENARRAALFVGAFYQDGNIICLCRPDKVFEPDEPPQFARLYRTPRLTGGVAAPRLGFASFLPNTGGVFDYAEALTSRRGLLLLRVIPRPIDPRKLHLAVCHPLMGEQATRLLPPPPLDLNPRRLGYEVTGYALLTSADHPKGGDLDKDDRRPTFRVLLTVIHSDEQLVHVYSYSSATGSWSPPIKCPQTWGALTMRGQRDGVVIRGTVHWVYLDLRGCLLCTLDVSADTGHVSVTKTPIQVQVDRGGMELLQPPFACVAGGKLSIVMSLRHDKLLFWTKREKDDGPVELGVPRGTKILAFAESKRAMLVQCGAGGGGGGLFTLDLQSMEMEPVNGEDSKWGYVRSCSSFSSHPAAPHICRHLTYNYRVLYEVDWPSYLHHLSTV